jgi:hypothetical protein
VITFIGVPFAAAGASSGLPGQVEIVEDQRVQTRADEGSYGWFFCWSPE